MLVIKNAISETVASYDVDMLERTRHPLVLLGLERLIEDVRYTYIVQSDGLYFNAAPGENIFSIHVDGISMPSIDGEGGDNKKFYTFDEVFILVVATEGPVDTGLAITYLKRLIQKYVHIPAE